MRVCRKGATLTWAHARGVTLRLIEPGKPTLLKAGRRQLIFSSPFVVLTEQNLYSQGSLSRNSGD
jgi:hypothetical protein